MANEKRGTGWLSRPVWGLLSIGVLVVLLTVPVGLIRELIDERLSTRAEAVRDVMAGWGADQSVVGPRLVIPFRESGDAPPGSPTRESVTVLPATLEVAGNVRTQALRRGLFSVPVYSARISLRGSFELGYVTALVPDAEALAWEAATLVIEVGHPKALGQASGIRWNGAQAAVEPGSMGSGGGIHAPVGVDPNRTQAFEITLDTRGAESLLFAPLGRATVVTIEADWAHPSFVGAWLPDRRSIDADEFRASWSVPALAREYPQAWLGSDHPTEAIGASSFGVSFATPVDHYRMAERSTKYAPLVLLMVFGLLWLFDTLVGVRLHVVQYVLVGAAMCLFYLLELSLSEVVGFTAAYAVASASVAGLIAAYAVAVLRSAGRGALVGGALGLLYAYLLALLSLERYALLAGSLGLFAALAGVMYSTRWVDWEALAGTGRPAET